jgi:ABC-type multidrug transport system permease subunit
MWIRSIFNIIKKDFKIFTRSKISAILVLILPLVVTLLAGMAFNSSNISDITISTYSNSYTNLTEEILLDFEKNYTVERTNSVENCINSVKLTNSQICIVFPSDLTSVGSEEEVIFHIDYSRINLAYNLLHEIEGKIDREASDLGVVLVQDLIDSLNKVNRDLTGEIKSVEEIRDGIDSNIEETEGIDVSIEDIDDAIDLLEDARSTANDSSAISKIDSSIELLETLKEEAESNSQTIGEIVDRNEELSQEIVYLSQNLESILEELNREETMEAKSIVSPINIKIESIKVDLNNREYLLPTILSILVLFGGILLASTFVLKEKKTKAYFRNFMTPTKDIVFILGTYLTCISIILIQFLLVFIGVEYILELNFVLMPLELLVVIVLSASVFIFLGMFIGYIFKSEETTIFAAILTSTVLMLFSNAIIPIEHITGKLKDVAMFNPSVLTDISFKKILLFNFSFGDFLTEIYALLGFIVFFLILTYVSRRANKRNL